MVLLILAVRSTIYYRKDFMKQLREKKYYEYFSYGAGSFFINLSMISERFGMYFLTDVAMLPASAVGLMLMVTTLFDAFNDPIIGNLADHNRSRFGRYRPFIIGGSLISCFSMILRFTNPSVSAPLKIAFYMAVLLIGSIGTTCCAVPWQAMGSLLSSDYDQRNILLMIRSAVMTIVTSVTGAVALSAVSFLGGNDSGWRNLVMLLWIPGLIAMYFCQDGMKSIDKPLTAKKKRKKFYLWGDLRQVWKNRAVIFLCVTIFLYNVIRAVWNNSDLYYFQYILEDTSAFSKAEGFGLPVTLACMFLLPFLLKYFDKRHILAAGALFNLLKPLMITVFGSQLSANSIIFLHLLSSDVGATLVSTLLFSLIPECVDWNHWNWGAKAAGLISACVTFTQKAGRGIGQWLLGLTLETSGFSAGQAISHSARTALVIVNGPVQIIGFILLLYLALSFPISKKKGEEIRRLLQIREQNK